MVAEEGGDLLFAPNAAQMYPRHQLITVDPGPVGRILEGESRPGHFAGVLTVVAKLLQLVRPDVAVFGEKDAQQLALVRRLAADLDGAPRSSACPPSATPTGSPSPAANRFLSPAERQTALLLPRGAAGRPGRGRRTARPRSAKPLPRSWARPADPALELDYLALVDPDTFEEAGEDYAGPGPAPGGRAGRHDPADRQHPAEPGVPCC